MLDIERLKRTYTNDLSSDVDLSDEAIASIEGICENMSDDEIYHHQRPLMLAYLAIMKMKEVKS